MAGDFTLELVSGSITPETAGKIVRFLDRVWPSQDPDYSSMAQGVHDWVREDPSIQLLLVWKENKLVGHARLFQRVVKCEGRQIALLALSSVCSHPLFRGQGIGRILVERAFEEVNLSHYPVCLFQTEKNDFYKRLGAVEVKNTFTNKLNKRSPQDNPWWEPHVMIYPDYPHWPEGAIDLNGPAF